LYDADTKLIRFGARDYDPATGRWTAKDPIRFDGDGPNLYGYTQNDPVNFVDLWGFLRRNADGSLYFGEKGRAFPNIYHPNSGRQSVLQPGFLYAADGTRIAANKIMERIADLILIVMTFHLLMVNTGFKIIR